MGFPNKIYHLGLSQSSPSFHSETFFFFLFYYKILCFSYLYKNKTFIPLSVPILLCFFFPRFLAPQFFQKLLLKTLTAVAPPTTNSVSLSGGTAAPVSKFVIVPDVEGTKVLDRKIEIKMESDKCIAKPIL